MYLNDTNRISATECLLGVVVTRNNLVATAESPAPASSSVPLVLTSLLVFYSLTEIVTSDEFKSSMFYCLSVWSQLHWLSQCLSSCDVLCAFQ